MASGKNKKTKKSGTAKVNAKVKAVGKAKKSVKVQAKTKAPLKKSKKASSSKKTSQKAPKKTAVKAKAPKKTAVASAPKKKASSSQAKKVSAKKSWEFTPIHDHVLVLPDGASEKTPGGLYIPATAQDRPLRGKVLAVGTGGFNKKGHLRPLDVKAGETVLYGAHAGSKVQVGGEELLVLKESEILGVSQG